MGAKAGLWLIAFPWLQPLRLQHPQGSRQMRGWTKPSAGVAATVQLSTHYSWGAADSLWAPNGFIELPPCCASSSLLFFRPFRSRGRRQAAEASSSSDLWPLPKPQSTASVLRNSRVEARKRVNPFLSTRPLISSEKQPLPSGLALRSRSPRSPPRRSASAPGLRAAGSSCSTTQCPRGRPVPRSAI